MNAPRDAADGLELVDIGINLTHDSYDHDREAVLQRALQAGRVEMVPDAAAFEEAGVAGADGVDARIPARGLRRGAPLDHGDGIRGFAQGGGQRQAGQAAADDDDIECQGGLHRRIVPQEDFLWGVRHGALHFLRSDILRGVPAPGHLDKRAPPTG